MRNRRAASRADKPSSIAAITRPRRSPLRLLVIFTSPQITESSEPDNADLVNPQADSVFIEDALASCLVFGWLALLTDEFRQLGKHTAAGFIANLVFWSEVGYFNRSGQRTRSH